MQNAELQDFKVHVRFRLCVLWASLMFCYIYGDYFELYQPGKLQGMIAERFASGAISQPILVGMAALMAVPSLMPFLSLVLPAKPTRVANIVLGTFYAVVMMVAIRGAWHFYIFLGLVEIGLSMLIVWSAWTWPKRVS